MESTRIKRNNEALYQAAGLLKDLNDQVVYLGGRIVGLLITDIIEDDVRPTYDIDVALNLGPTDIVAHYSIQKKLESLGFKPEGNITCRYVKDDLIIDVMYTDGNLQGINSNWYQPGFESAIHIKLEDKNIKILNAVYFIAIKLEVFTDRAYNINDYWDCGAPEAYLNSDAVFQKTVLPYPAVDS